MKSGLLATFLCATLAFGWTARLLGLVGEVFLRLLFCDGFRIDILRNTYKIAAARAFDVWSVGAFYDLNISPIGYIRVALLFVKRLSLFQRDSVWIKFFAEWDIIFATF